MGFQSPGWGIIFAGIIAWPAFAQPQDRVARVGFLSSYTEEGGRELIRCFKSSLAKYGWIEGQNVRFDHRWAEGRGDRYSALASELAAMDLDLIAVNSTPASQAMQRAIVGKKTPVVFMSVSDPVESGIVESLARSGGNMTGVSNLFPAMSGKMLEYIKAIVPDLSKTVVIRDIANAGKDLDIAELKANGQKLNVEVVDGSVRNAAEIKQRFAEFSQTKPGAVIVLVDGVTLSSRDLIIDLVKQSRLPAIYQVRDFVEAGGLISYGLNFCQHFSRAASYANNILKGAKPADLPVELPATFELVVNAKAVKDLNLKLPPTLLSAADEVFE